MATKKIKPGEHFQLHDTIFEYEVDTNGAIKIKKIKEVKKALQAFVPPTQEEVIAFFEAEGYTKAGAIKAFRYYDPEWKDGNGKPVKNWKQKMRGNWLRDEFLAPIQKTPDKNEDKPLIM